MPSFTASGAKARDLWSVDGSPQFATFPGGILTKVPIAIPIWLRVGTIAFGEIHIRTRHGHWVSKTGKSVPEFVYEKLGQSGSVYSTEMVDKVKVSLRLNPASLLIMNLISHGHQDHFSVTSLYIHPARLDGNVVGRYPGRRTLVPTQINLIANISESEAGGK